MGQVTQNMAMSIGDDQKLVLLHSCSINDPGNRAYVQATQPQEGSAPAPADPYLILESAMATVSAAAGMCQAVDLLAVLPALTAGLLCYATHACSQSAVPRWWPFLLLLGSWLAVRQRVAAGWVCFMDRALRTWYILHCHTCWASPKRWQMLLSNHNSHVESACAVCTSNHQERMTRALHPYVLRGLPLLESAILTVVSQWLQQQLGAPQQGWLRNYALLLAGTTLGPPLARACLHMLMRPCSAGPAAGRTDSAASQISSAVPAGRQTTSTSADTTGQVQAAHLAAKHAISTASTTSTTSTTSSTSTGRISLAHLADGDGAGPPDSDSHAQQSSCNKGLCTDSGLELITSRKNSSSSSSTPDVFCCLVPEVKPPTDEDNLHTDLVEGHLMPQHHCTAANRSDLVAVSTSPGNKGRLQGVTLEPHSPLAHLLSPSVPDLLAPSMPALLARPAHVPTFDLSAVLHATGDWSEAAFSTQKVPAAKPQSPLATGVLGAVASMTHSKAVGKDQPSAAAVGAAAGKAAERDMPEVTSGQCLRSFKEAAAGAIAITGVTRGHITAVPMEVLPQHNKSTSGFRPSRAGSRAAYQSCVQRAQTQPYVSRLHPKTKVCIKLTTDMQLSELPRELAGQLHTALANIGYPRHHLLDIAARPGCILLSLDIYTEHAIGAQMPTDSRSGCNGSETSGAGGAASLEAHQITQALLPAVTQLLSAHHSSSGHSSGDHKGGAARRGKRRKSGVEMQHGPACLLSVRDLHFTASWEADSDSWMVVPASSEPSAAPLSLPLPPPSSPDAPAWVLLVLESRFQNGVGMTRTAETGHSTDVLHKVSLCVRLLPGVSRSSDGSVTGGCGVVGGWTPAEAGMHEVTQPSMGFQILACCDGSYLTTSVRPADANNTEPEAAAWQEYEAIASTTSQLTVEVLIPDSILSRHHLGAAPTGVLPISLELWHGMQCITSAPLLLPTHSQAEGSRQAWWWGTSGKGVGAAMKQLQQLGGQLQTSAAAECMQFASPHEQEVNSDSDSPTNTTTSQVPAAPTTQIDSGVRPAATETVQTISSHSHQLGSHSDSPSQIVNTQMPATTAVPTTQAQDHAAASVPQVEIVAVSQAAVPQAERLHAVRGWQAFMADLTTWLQHLRQVTPLVPHQCLSPQTLFRAVPGTTLPEPALSPDTLLRLGQDLATHADDVGLWHVQGMLKQQLEVARAWHKQTSTTTSPACLDVSSTAANSSGSTQRSLAASMARLLRASALGLPCPQCEARCRHQLSEQYAAVQVYSSMALALVGLFSFPRMYATGDNIFVWLPAVIARIVLSVHGIFWAPTRRLQPPHHNTNQASRAQASHQHISPARCNDSPHNTGQVSRSQPSHSISRSSQAIPARKCNAMAVVVYVTRSIPQLQWMLGLVPVTTTYQTLLKANMIFVYTLLLSLGEQLQVAVQLPLPGALLLTSLVEVGSHLLVAARVGMATPSLLLGLLLSILGSSLAMDMKMRSVIIAAWGMSNVRQEQVKGSAAADKADVGHYTGMQEGKEAREGGSSQAVMGTSKTKRE